MPIDPEDQEKIVEEVELIVNKIPPMVRRFALPPLPELLKKIPPTMEKYTVKEITEFLGKAWEEGRIRW
ncbi:MAG: hypothetical protein DRO11_02395 [Methanobacteriota archaeon]|nr:MAG: hypothetical protein DRO11_02395 [Euryarchaeota archaeon]